MFLFNYLKCSFVPHVVTSNAGTLYNRFVLLVSEVTEKDLNNRINNMGLLNKNIRNVNEVSSEKLIKSMLRLLSTMKQIELGFALSGMYLCSPTKRLNFLVIFRAWREAKFRYKNRLPTKTISAFSLETSGTFDWTQIWRFDFQWDNTQCKLI